MLLNPLGDRKGEVRAKTKKVDTALILLALGYGIVAAKLLAIRFFQAAHESSLSYDDFAASSFAIRTIPVSPKLLPIESSRPKIV